MRGVEPGARDAAGAAHARRLRHRGDGSEKCRFHPPRDRDHEARLRRPRGLLRRSGAYRDPRGNPAGARLCRRPPRSDWRDRLARTPAGADRRARGLGRRRHRPRRCQDNRRSRHGGGRADHGAPDRTAGRHGAYRRDRPVGQFGVGHALGRLAAILAGGAGPRHAAQLAGTDVLARRGPAHLAGAGPPAEDHAVAVDGRGAGRHAPCFRHAGRRPAGPVAADPVPAHGPCRAEPSGSDRRAPVSHRAFPGVVLSARHTPRPSDAGTGLWRGNDRGPSVPRPRCRGCRTLDRGPPDRRLPHARRAF